MENLQPLINLLSGDHGNLAAAVAWVGAARLALKPVNTWLLAFFDRVVIYVHNTPEQEDDALLLRFLGSRGWVIFAFLCDTLGSVKLPTAATVKATLEKIL